MPLSRIVVAGLLAFGLPAGAQTPNAKDVDLACAVAATIEAGKEPAPDADVRRIYFAMTSFYIGRLSARDDKARWTAIIGGRIAERHDQPNPPGLIASCVEFYKSKLVPQQ